MHRAAQLVRNGKIGKLQRIITMTPKDPTLPVQPDMPAPEELDFEMWQGPAVRRPYTVRRVHPRQDAKGRPGWLCISDYADGMMANWGAHLNDIALWGADLDHSGPGTIEGSGTFPPKGNLWDVISEFDVTFTYANGVTLQCKTQSPVIRWEGTVHRRRGRERAAHAHHLARTVEQTRTRELKATSCGRSSPARSQQSFLPPPSSAIVARLTSPSPVNCTSSSSSTGVGTLGAPVSRWRENVGCKTIAHE